MTKKKLDVTCPVFAINGDELNFIAISPRGTLVFATADEDRFIRSDPYGKFKGRQILTQTAPETVEYLSLYPNGQIYNKSCCPVRTSSYDIKNDLIQIKVTRRGGKIVGKEFC